MQVMKFAGFARYRRALSVLALGAVVLAGVALANRYYPLMPLLESVVGGERGHEPDGKGEKQPTGQSFEKQTRVERYSGPSSYSLLLNAERVWSGYDDWEPALAIQPGTSVVYQATTRYNGPKACNGCPFPIIVLRKSIDGGETWGADLKIPNFKAKQNDPEIEVATDGTLYLAWMDEYKPGIAFAKSSNGGASWSTPIHLTPRGGTPDWSDKPLLAMSANGQHVYVGLNASDNYVAASHDYGATFTMSPKLNNDTRYWFHTAGAVAPNGDAYFITSDFSQDYTGDAYIRVMKSSNGGASWTITTVDTSKEMPECAWSAGCYFGFFGTIAGLAGDSAGKVMIAYTASTVNRGPMQLYARTSTNGTTWSARQDIGAGSAFNHHSVAVASSGMGDFAVTWQDDRNGANTAWNAWLRQTSNGGNTWDAPLRLSDQASGAPYKSAAGHGFPYGDYQEIAADSSGHYHVIWGEGISYTGPGGTWYTKSY
jgi:hypothetical protein